MCIRDSEYLNKFPFANQYYQTQFYLAEALFSSQRFEEAIVEYDALLKVPGEEWTEAAQVRIFVSWFNLLNQRYGDLKNLPPDAVVERTEETKSGEQRTTPLVQRLQIEGLLKNYPTYSGKDEALFYLGRAYADLARPEDAQATYARLREEHPESRYIRKIPEKS